MTTCAMCNYTPINKSHLLQHVQYGAGKDEVILHVIVPVYSCDKCGEMYTDHEAESIRQNAIDTYIKSLSD